ncbi:MAG: transposase [Chloroflexota bacterium]|nr:transposase [Chloroflexota bacterium]
MMKSLAPLQPGLYYHIYNRGNNREDLFYEERNYHYFLQLYTRHIYSIADTFAYCLMRNHFHLLVRIKETSQVLETCEVFNPSQYFSNLFNAYAKAINKAYGRTGSLFEERFGRVEITSDAHFVHLIFYIHFNPQKHGFVDDFCDWRWSSYNTLLSTGTTKLKRAEVLDWFDGRAGFEEFHRGLVDEKALQMLIDENIQ